MLSRDNLIKHFYDFLGKFIHWSNRLNEVEFIGVAVSALVSVMIELFRHSLMILTENDFLIDCSFLRIFCDRHLIILHSVVNIFLITAIVWCITIVISMLDKCASHKPQQLSLLFLLMFVFSVAWYSCESIIAINWVKIIVSTIVTCGLYMLLFMFIFYRKNIADSDSTSDYSVASIPPSSNKLYY